MDHFLAFQYKDDFIEVGIKIYFLFLLRTFIIQEEEILYRKLGKYLRMLSLEVVGVYHATALKVERTLLS